VAMLSARSAGPYMPDMPMQPSAMAETFGPDEPSWRTCMSLLLRCGIIAAAYLGIPAPCYNSG
jgi:hypothetical protein